MARFFKSGDAFRRWLATHAGTARELVVGFYKKSSGHPGLTYAEALDQALCFGWIDGVRKSLDDERYTIRFSPRQAKSIWSRVNLRHIERLKKAGLMNRRGLEVFEGRDPARAGLYSFENRPRAFDRHSQALFKATPVAWTFFRAQPPGYQRVATFYVMSAKREDTRLRRLQRVIDCSRCGERLPTIAQPLKKKG